ncbi:MAG: 3-dehydroquinate dehydratase [Bacillales bacterium]|nr:3-dehydroquinate dehydratase [Bacillales bacterium]
MRILIVNGVNINLLGLREPLIYGLVTYKQLLKNIKEWSHELSLKVKVVQSNHEGKLVDFIQKYKNVDGIIINPGAYTHTSIALLDVLKAVNKPSIEVHISDVSEREAFRQVSYIKEYCFKTISGQGILGYKKALKEIKENIEGKNK